MPGFLTHYLFGMESCDALSDNYIQNLIRSNNHAFLVGLQGSDLLPFNPHALSRRGLSYRTAAATLRNQEYAALFHNMLDFILTLQGSNRDTCTAYLAGYLCYYAIDQAASPYILYKVWQELPAKCSGVRMASHKREVETVIDTVLLRNHCHMEPSQLNFEALTFINKKDITVIGQMLRYAFQATYHTKIPVSDIASGIRGIRHKYVYLQPGNTFQNKVVRTIGKAAPRIYHKKIFEDFIPDENDYMNEEEKPWYPYPGYPDAYHYSFEELFQMSLMSSRTLLENLDSCLAWGMDSEDLILSIIHLSPYS